MKFDAESNEKELARLDKLVNTNCDRCKARTDASLDYCSECGSLLISCRKKRTRSEMDAEEDMTDRITKNIGGRLADGFAMMSDD